MCEIGCRYSDLSVITKDRVTKDKGKPLIKYSAVKNKKLNKVPLTPKALEIIERWKGFRDTEHLIPPMPHSNFNEYMIRIGKRAGIDENVYIRGQWVPKYQKLTAHVARRTFVKRCLTAGISHLIIMKWVGHSEFDTFRKYYDITEDDSLAEYDKMANF